MMKEREAFIGKRKERDRVGFMGWRVGWKKENEWGSAKRHPQTLGLSPNEAIPQRAREKTAALNANDGNFLKSVKRVSVSKK